MLPCSRPKDFPKAKKGTQASRHPISPHVSPWAPQLEEQSTPAPIPALSARLRCLPRGCNAGEAGASTRCPNLLRLVLFQQDFLVPVVPRRGHAGLGWAAASPATSWAGSLAARLDLGWAWARGGLLAADPWGQAPAGCRCSRGGGEPALSSPAGEVMPLAGDTMATREGSWGPHGPRDVALSLLLPARATKRAARGGGLSCPPSPNFMDPPATDGAAWRNP